MDTPTRIRIPNVVTRRTLWRYMAAFVLATTGMVVFAEVPSTFAFGSLLLGLGLVAVARYASRQTWIVMDHTGFVVRTTFGWGRFHVDWSAEIVGAPFVDQPGLSGFSFSETRTGRAFFLPNSVIYSLEFANAVQLFAPKGHVFRQVGLSDALASDPRRT